MSACVMVSLAALVFGVFLGIATMCLMNINNDDEQE